MSNRVKPPVTIPKEYLTRLNINGLRGRMLHIPYQGKNKRVKKIVMVGGQHVAHERLYALAQVLSDYGEVYVPDMPGFGGMTSFFKIGKKATYDDYADYLYSFLKSRKLTKDVTFFC